MPKLNEDQMAAVTAPDGPVLVLAGAGSGKTRVIIERMAYLVQERGVQPWNILALTFTNKAADEMRGRFVARIAHERVSTFLGTFHAFGLHLLRREIKHLGRESGFTIYDDTDQLSLMKRLVKELSKSTVQVSPRDALGWISRIKQVEPFPVWEQSPASPTEKIYRILWDQYHDTLRRANALDYDDLTALTAHLLEHHEDVRHRHQEHYRHILVDEYQDTNRSQYLIARFLAEHGNLFVVGDEDQSIYSWRGADIHNILDFTEDFPHAHVYRLEENYRSTQSILDAANAVVAHNVNRLGKKLFTRNGAGDPVRFFPAYSPEAEADFIASDILRRDLSADSIAVFYRVHTLSRLMEDALRRHRISYTVVGGIKFYGRKEVKDILAYLRLVCNPKDDESMLRIINVPPRGIGETTRAYLTECARARQKPLLEILREVEHDETIGARARKSAVGLADLLDELRDRAEKGAVEHVVEMLLQRTAYREYVEQSDEKEYRNRIEVVNEFVLACRQHDQRTQTRLEGFLQELALVSDIDAWDNAKVSATLMTCHSAKGLEFDHVYLLGMEEEIFPLIRDESDIDFEEERRLCYVAMTRARKTLTLSASQVRALYGPYDDVRRPSRFLGEIGGGRLVRVDAQGRAQTSRAPKTHSPSGPSNKTSEETTKVLKKGDVVLHAQFGAGVVLSCTGHGVKSRARIRFDSGRISDVMVHMAPMEVLKKS